MGRTFVKKQLPVGSAAWCKSQFVHQINFKLYKTEKVSKYPPFEKKLFSAILLSEGQRGESSCIKLRDYTVRRGL